MNLAHVATAAYLFLAIVGPFPITSAMRWLFQFLAAGRNTGHRPRGATFYLTPLGWLIFLFVGVLVYGLIFFAIVQLVDQFGSSL